MTLASSAVDQISASRFGVYEELLQYLQGDTTWYVQQLNNSGESWCVAIGLKDGTSKSVSNWLILFRMWAIPY